MAKDISKAKASAIDTAEQSQIREIRSFKASKTINTGLIDHEEAVYMDFASDVHTLWGRVKFDEHAPSACQIY